MTIHSPGFNINNFELRGETNSFLDSDQSSTVADLEIRVPGQLNWIAQLLGWSGSNYWNSFTASVDQKRQLLTGSFGIYNGYFFPEIVEVRNQTNTVVVKDNPYILNSQTFYLGDYEYVSQGVAKVDNNLHISFPTLSDQFYSDIEANEQLKFISNAAIPAPFSRPLVGISGDRSFLCKVGDGAITLYPFYDADKTLPYLYNVFFAGSRYYFDIPVKLFITENVSVLPVYDFNTGSWYIDVPCHTGEANTGLSGRLDYGDHHLVVSIKSWVDPSDWIKKDTIDYFRGVWGNKGGPLPFHFTFDAMSIHGFDEKKSVHLGKVERSVKFDDLLKFVYQQVTPVGELPPPIGRTSKVWWDSEEKQFFSYVDDPLNCGPWTEDVYSQSIPDNLSPDLTFSTVAAFTSYPGTFGDGTTVLISDCSGLGASNKVYGLTQTLTGPAQAYLVRQSASDSWVPLRLIYTDILTFDADTLKLPPETLIYIQDANGLSGLGSNFIVANLKITINGQYVALLMKHATEGSWYLQPPTKFKYIGNTRLFESSQNWNSPVEGETSWEYSQPVPSNRQAYIFYYDEWQYNILLSEWELIGHWYNLDMGVLEPAPANSLDFFTILVYCDGTLLSDGEELHTDNFQIKYAINPVSGEFDFTYLPFNYTGTSKLPRITISDSLTTSYTYDISDYVFSGLTYYMSPNVEDSETLLRLWKSPSLFCISDVSDYNRLSYPNALISGENEGPANDDWERYFIRLAPSYQRNGTNWQRVNLICQDFGYWGSPPLPETMVPPSQEARPSIYEELAAQRGVIAPNTFIYSEPYLYSDLLPDYGFSDLYEDSEEYSCPVQIVDGYEEGYTVDYDPLHERHADTISAQGKGYGDWLGSYYFASECVTLNGHLIKDIEIGAIDSVPAPIWDSSMYKLPVLPLLDQESALVDSNHFLVGYAFFASDLSAAGEATFDFG